MSANQRQEVFNVVLAGLLQDRGVVVAPETITYEGIERKRQMPDVLVNYQGWLRIAIEGEVDAPNAREKALRSAAQRVENKIAYIGVGVVYPAELRQVHFSKLKEELARARLEIAFVTEAGQTGFTSGDIDYLERALRSTFEQLIREDVVAEAVALIDTAVDQFAGVTLSHPGIWGRITEVLGGAVTESELAQLTPQQRGANCRIGGLVLINAMIFHDVLSSYERRVSPLNTLIQEKQLDSLPESWKFILDNINYFSIFHIARLILLTTVGIPETITLLAETALKISTKRAALRHDLMGRVYHRLLAEAKYLGTYYTSIPAATLLLKLALRPDGWDIKWDDAKAVSELRIADPSCGTGTLLMASADAVIDNYVQASANGGNPVEQDGLRSIHQHIAEDILYGYDVLPSAIHLTASTLAMRTPEIALKRMNLFALPLGGADRRLGSIEFLSGSAVQIPLDNFGAITTVKQVTGTGEEELLNASMRQLDLCVMNPPFVRSVGGNLLFGSLPSKERADLQTKLKTLIKTNKAQANITSGLGSVFIAVGHRHIKDGGRLALILPKALLSGVSWGESRDLINQRYRIDYVIVSHDAERWNFSESTDLSEVLLIATKHERGKSRAPAGHKTIVVNLWRNPTNSLEALSVASDVLRRQMPDLITGQGTATVTIGGEKAGEAITFPWEEMQKDWFLPCAFAQADLTRSAYQMLKGKLALPGHAGTWDIRLRSLGELGVLGPDRRDIHDGFEISEKPTPYPTFWGHNAESVTTIAQEHNRYLAPLSEAKVGRSLRRVTDLWPLSGTILLAERMWLKTQRLVAVRLSQRVLSNVWWSFAFNKDFEKTGIDKALVLWLNSTLALMMLFATRDETRGAWVDFKKPSLAAMPVLDLGKLTQEQLQILNEAYDRICSQELKPLPQMADDEVRAEIDRAIGQALNLPDISVLRTMLGREPVVCMQRL